jgi:uncharacterized membrane protein YagU involved in acid resistance
MKKPEPEDEFIKAWQNLSPYDRFENAAKILTASLVQEVNEAFMRNRGIRIAFTLFVLVYIIVFCANADRAPQIVFAAGVLIGGLLALVWIAMIIPWGRRNGNGHHNGPGDNER